jgi:molecular chaperone GrpE (heat shock protein)
MTQRDPHGPSRDDPFAIDESPIPVHAWPSDAEGQNTLDAVEADMRHLFKELAEARLSLSEAGRQEEGRVDKILLGVLEACDAFERIFRTIHAKQDQVNRQMKIWIGNFRTIKRLLDTLLRDQDVKSIENLDGGFDPHWHKITETVSDPSKLDGTVVEEVRRGYIRGKKILRKSEVVVVRNAV